MSACRLTEGRSVGDDEGDSKRLEMKRLIRQLKEVYPTVDRNIFHSVHNVSLDTMIRWKYDGREFSFLDGYED